MLKISTPYKYDLDLKDEYKKSYETINDSPSLHKYLLCLLTDEEEFQEIYSDEKLAELKSLLYRTVSDKEVQNYEVLFYYELCRATNDIQSANEYLEEHPEQKQNCKINNLAYFFLKQLMMLDAAEDYLNEAFNVSAISYEMFCYERIDIYRLRGDLLTGYEITKAEVTEADYFAPSTIFNIITDVAIELNLENDCISFYQAAIEKTPHVKWISLGYIKLCQKMDLQDLISAEYSRLLDMIAFFYKEKGVDRKNSGIFSFYCSVRKQLGLSTEFEDAANDAGVSISITKTEIEPQPQVYDPELHDSDSNIWINNLFRKGNKSLSKRITKMNKPLKTFYKVFANQEKEIIFSKSIFANIISLINHRFNTLFGESHFTVTDYDLFYETFPFYDLNGFSEEEIDEVSTLLTRIYYSSIQLNPHVPSHSYTAGQMLVELLSINTTIEVGNKTFEYKAFDESSGQLTVFGITVFLTTFLTKTEKNFFANDLAGSDSAFTSALVKQIFDTIPNANPAYYDDLGLSFEYLREKTKFSLILRKELFRFLFEFEAKILRKHMILDEVRPSCGALSFQGMLNLEFESETTEFNNLRNIHYAACTGVEIGDYYNPENQLTIRNITDQIEECISNNDFYEILQAELEVLFTTIVNRKYYNYLKWLNGKAPDGFLSIQNEYCKKMIYRNENLVTEDDEFLLFDCTKDRKMSYLDDIQRDEMSSIFGSKTFDWEKIEIIILEAPEEECQVIINGEQIIRNETDKFCFIKDKDSISIEANPPYSFSGFESNIIFDSPIAKFILKRVILSEV